MKLLVCCEEILEEKKKSLSSQTSVLDSLQFHTGPAVAHWLQCPLLKFSSGYSLYAKFFGIFRARCFPIFPLNNGKTFSVSSALQARTVIPPLQLFPQSHEYPLKFNVLFDESLKYSSDSCAL